MDNIKKLVERMRGEASHIQKKYQIVLLTNSRSKTRIINNQRMEYSENNEFFSDQEYNEIFEGIQSGEFYVKPHFNEINFILETLEDSHYKNDKLVYNLSRNGNHVGKKSLIPAFCDLLSIPYTGSNALITSFCRAKYMYTKYLESHGVKTPKTWLYSNQTSWLNNEQPKLGIKVVMKPMHESASIGLDTNSIFVFDKEALSRLTKQSAQNENEYILIQEFIEGYECEVPLFISNGIHVMEPVGISINENRNLKSDILTFDHSYHDKYDFYMLSKELNQTTSNRIKEIAAKVTQLINLGNYGRVDFRINYQGEPYVIDIATSPYTTRHSSFAYLFNNFNLAYEDIYSTIIGLAYMKFEQHNSFQNI